MPKITPKRKPRPLEVRTDLSPSQVVAARDTRSNFGKLNGAGVADMIRADEKRKRALEMRLDGAGLQKIAEELNVSMPRVHIYLTELWAPLIEDVAQLQADRTNLQLQDIETIRSRLMPYLMADNLTIEDIQEKKVITLSTFDQLCRVSDRLIKLMEHEAKLLRITQSREDSDLNSGKRTLDRETLTLVYHYQRERNANEKQADAHEVA